MDEDLSAIIIDEDLYCKLLVATNVVLIIFTS